MELAFELVDPTNHEVRALLDRHLEYAHEVTPSGHVHALPVEGLLSPDVTLYGARRSGELVGVGALRQLNESHAEIKSMHTREDVRGEGIGRAMLLNLLSVAAAQGYERVSLETGTMDAFAPAGPSTRVPVRQVCALRQLHRQPQQRLYDPWFPLTPEPAGPRVDQ